MLRSKRRCSGSSSISTALHGRKGVLPLVTVCLLIHCCALADIMLQPNNRGSLGDALLVGASLVSLGTVVLLPKAGSWAILAVWCISLFPCGLWGALPDEFLVSCMMAVGILGYSHLEYGVTSSVVVAGMSWLLPAIGRESFSVSVGFSQSLFVLLALLVLSAVVGGFVRQGRRQTELIDMVQRRNMNLEIAHMLHDYIANDVTDALLLLQRSQCGDSTCISEAIGCLDDAAHHSRALIDRLDDASCLDGIMDMPIAGVGGLRRADDRIAGDEILKQLHQIERTQQSRLELSGHEGAILIPEMIPGNDDADTVRLLIGLVRELCANISKHADARFGYVLTVEALLNKYVVRLRDADAVNADTASGGTGLSRFRAQLAKRGGELQVVVREENGIRWWSMEACIPRESNMDS